MYYLCIENKGADQLHGHREADLCLCFRICKTLVFSWRGSYFNVVLFVQEEQYCAALLCSACDFPLV